MKVKTFFVAPAFRLPWRMDQANGIHQPPVRLPPSANPRRFSVPAGLFELSAPTFRSKVYTGGKRKREDKNAGGGKISLTVRNDGPFPGQAWVHRHRTCGLIRLTLRVFPSYALINKEAACWAAFLLGEDFEPFFRAAWASL